MTIRGAPAPRLCRLHELEFARTQRLTPHEPRVPDPADDRQREHDIGKAGAQDGDQRNGEQDAGKRHQDINGPADHIVDRAAEVAGDRTHQHPDGGRHRDHGDPDEQ